MSFLEETDTDIMVSFESPEREFAAILKSDSEGSQYLCSNFKQQQRKKINKGSRMTYDVNSTYDEDIPYFHENVQDITKELQLISHKLKEENRALHDREQVLQQREHMLNVSQANLRTITDLDVKHKIQAMQEKHQAELSLVENQVKEKMKENKRLKDNFDTLKTANDTLREELERLQRQHEKLEKDASSVQARLINLQRKQEFRQRQKRIKETESEHGMVEKPKSKMIEGGLEKTSRQTKVTKPLQRLCEMLPLLLEWVSEAHLRCSVMERSESPEVAVKYIQDKCLKIIPVLVVLLRELPYNMAATSLPCLQFIYWALNYLEYTHSLQKSSLMSTMRRLGEELYQQKHLKSADSGEARSPPSKRVEGIKDGLYFRSSLLHIRILSALIILKTVTQVDLLAHVLDELRNDLKSDAAKELFLYYRATMVILPYIKPVNKALVNSALDIVLQMSMESPYLAQFLASCGNEAWFRSIALMLRAPNLDEKILEKLSILLQKLSKIRSNKRFFDVYTITRIIQELCRSYQSDGAFLALNLRSIVFNLSLPSTGLT